MTKTKAESDTPTIYNGFTVSYRLRFIVHGYRRGEDKTLCGRAMVHASTELYSQEVEGACRRCNMHLANQERMHPGWPKGR